MKLSDDFDNEHIKSGISLGTMIVGVLFLSVLLWQLFFWQTKNNLPEITIPYPNL